MAKRLTDAAIKRFKPDPTRRREIPDAGKPGLYLVIQPSGRKSWAVRYRFNGKPRKYTLPGFPSLATAHTLAQDVLDKVAEGLDPAKEKRAEKRAAGEPDRDLFRAMAEQFLDRYAKPKNKSYIESARLIGLKPDAEGDGWTAIKGRLAEKWGERRVQDIARRDVIEELDRIVDRGAPFVANRTLAALRKFFNWCVSRDVLATSPCAGVKAPAPEKARDRVLSDDELRWLWKATDGEEWFGPVVKMLVLTGQRREEVRGMRRAEIDAEARLWTVPATRTKGARPQEVPLSDAAIAVLDAAPKVKGKAGYVFTSNGEKPLNGYSRAKDRLDASMLEIAREEKGADVTIPPWRFHDIRRTVASGMARLGVDLPVIEKVLSHTSGSFGGIVGVYQRHSFADEKRRALEAWGRFVTTLVEGKPENVVELRKPEAAHG